MSHYNSLVIMILKKITTIILYLFVTAFSVSNAFAQDSLFLDIQQKSGEKGSTVCLDVTARNFINIESIQFNLSYNATLIVPKCPAQNINPGLQGSFFGDIFNCNSKDNGYLRFVWANNATTIPNGQILFTLCFDVIGDAGNTSPVSVNSNILDIEVCKEVSGRSVCTVPLVTKSGSIKVTSSTLQLITSYCEAETGKKGSFTFYGTGGNPPYTYTVNSNEYTGTGIQDGQRVTIANVVTKNYNVVITDGLGVSQTKLVPMDSISVGLRYNLTVQEPTCSTSKNGKIKLNTQPDLFGRTYLYQWSNLVSGRNMDSLIDLGAGKYFVTITNESTGCEILDSTELRRAPINMGLTVQSPAACNQSGVFGFIEVNASGGVPKTVGNPYRIIINRGQNFGITPPYLLGQRAGRYEITVTDSLGCFKTDSIVIPFTSVLDMTAAKVDIECKGAQNGSAVITVGPYSKDYVYFGMNDLTRNALGPVNPRADTIKLNNLLPGFYQIRTSHGTNSCRDTVSFTITEPQDSLKINPAIIQPGCNVTGSITLNASGGNGGYTYNWNPPQSPNTTSVANLTGGTFRITVTDSKNCVDSVAITLNPQGALFANLSRTKEISCAGKSDAKLKVAPSGGNSPYTFEWKNSTSQIISQADTLVNIAAGTYFFQVTDKDGCKSLLDSVTLADPAKFTTVKSPVVSTKCNNSSDGTAEINIVGGNTGYTFEWQRSGDTSVINRDNKLTEKAGTYIVHSINAAGCRVSDTLSITAPDAISFNQVVNQPKCDTLGSITLNPSGGTPGYSFKWNQSPADTLNNLLNLDGGNYQVTVTDANNCTATFTQMLNPSGRPQITAKSTNISCYGVKDGSLTVNIPIANGPFDIVWRDSTGNSAGIGQNLFNQGPGRYTVVVTDVNKCASVPQTVTIIQPDSITYSKNITDAICFEENGNAAIQILGGNAGYTFDWKNASNQTIGRADTISLKAGTYTVGITNSSNCSKTDTVIIVQPAKITFPRPDTIAERCFGQSDGRAAIFGSPLNFSWSNGTVAPFALNLPKGVHWVTAFDNNNCKSDTIYFNIGGPSKIELDQSMSITANPRCFGENNGSFSIAAKGGTGNGFRYNWSNGRSGDFQDNLAAGKYIVTITDSANCMITDSVTLDQPQELNVIKDIASFKNPDCINLTGGSTGFVITGGSAGQKLITWQAGVNSTSEKASGLRSGIYCATVTDAQGCSVVFCDTLTQALKEVKLTPNVSKPITCNGSNDGSLSVAVSGNNVPFNVIWKDISGSEISKDSTVVNLKAGKYYVLVKEINADGCQSTDSILLTEPTKITFPNPETRKVTCFGLATGQAAIVGGPAGLTYTWSSGSTGLFAANLTTGMSWVVAKDNKNCISDTTFFDTGTFEVLRIDDSKTQLIDASCFGGSNGSVRIIAAGGTGLTYAYRWQNGITGPELNNLSTGTYKVTIMDSNNCQETDSILISQPSELIASIDLSKSVGLDCKGTEAGKIAIKTQGGNPGLKTITWQSGLTVDNGVAIGLKAGTYCATVTDNFGCKDTFCYDLFSPSKVFGSINTPAPPQCSGGTTCISVKSISGGTGNKYTFQINNGKRYPIDTCVTVTAGQYFISFIDSAGCSADTIITINQPIPIFVDLGPDVEMNLGQEPIFLKVDINSSLNVDSVIWTPKNALNCLTSDCISVEVNPLETTTYLASVTDANGCKGSDEVTVFVNNIRNVYFPNIFTPNRDGFNDYFQAIVGPGVEKIIAFSIYDRWGNMVFDKSDFIPDPAGTDGWDGTYNGVRLDPGVFVYFAKAKFIDGREIQYSGSVTLADKVRN
jgi:gliding motility-associated-like protein